MNREEYLNTAISLIHSEFFQGEQQPKIRATVSPMPNSRLGECHPSQNSMDQTFELAVSAKLDNPVTVIQVATHEYCHALAGTEAKHGPQFQLFAKRAGLQAPFTTLNTTPLLDEKAEELADLLGPYPHAELVMPAKEKGRNNNKLVCNTCDFKSNLSAKWASQINHGFECPVCQDTNTQVEMSA